jgi:hypothetical protein
MKPGCRTLSSVCSAFPDLLFQIHFLTRPQLLTRI